MKKKEQLPIKIEHIDIIKYKNGNKFIAWSGTNVIIPVIGEKVIIENKKYEVKEIVNDYDKAELIIAVKQIKGYKRKE